MAEGIFLDIWIKNWCGKGHQFFVIGDVKCEISILNFIANYCRKCATMASCTWTIKLKIKVSWMWSIFLYDVTVHLPINYVMLLDSPDFHYDKLWQ